MLQTIKELSRVEGKTVAAKLTAIKPARPRPPPPEDQTGVAEGERAEEKPGEGGRARVSEPAPAAGVRPPDSPTHVSAGRRATSYSPPSFLEAIAPQNASSIIS